jgi:hypothetical protein
VPYKQHLNGHQATPTYHWRNRGVNPRTGCKQSSVLEIRRARNKHHVKCTSKDPSCCFAGLDGKSGDPGKGQNAVQDARLAHKTYHSGRQLIRKRRATVTLRWHDNPWASGSIEASHHRLHGSRRERRRE